MMTVAETDDCERHMQNGKVDALELIGTLIVISGMDPSMKLQCTYGLVLLSMARHRAPCDRVSSKTAVAAASSPNMQRRSSSTTSTSREI